MGDLAKQLQGVGPAGRNGGIELGLALLGVLIALAGRFRDLARPFFADDFLFLESARGKSLVGALLAPDPLGNFFRPVSRAL